MGRTKKLVTSDEKLPIQRPATSSEARENQLIALATDVAEKQLREGTASAQVICHYLKLGSSTEKLEQELKEKQVELAKAKADAIQAAKNSEELFIKAIAAMKSYQGSDEPDV